MKVMIDTNIIISAALFPDGKAAAALFKAMTDPYETLLCNYVIDELHKKFWEKFPDKMDSLEMFLSQVFLSVKIVATPENAVEAESRIRDPKDRPILRAALNAHADLFLTGDKDFLESSVTDPRIISAAGFLDMAWNGQLTSFIDIIMAPFKKETTLKENNRHSLVNSQWRKDFMDLQDYVDIAREEGRAEERANTEREKARADAAEAEIAKLKERLTLLEKTSRQNGSF